MTRTKRSIEVVEATATVLEAQAASRGVSVSEIVAELVPLAVDSEAIAELDRRWKAVASGGRTARHDEVELWLQSWGTPTFRPWHDLYRVDDERLVMLRIFHGREER
jgi:predicted transcriptional regulator